MTDAPASIGVLRSWPVFDQAVALRAAESTSHAPVVRPCRADSSQLSVLIDRGGSRRQVQRTDISAETGGLRCCLPGGALGAPLGFFVLRVLMIMSSAGRRDLRVDRMAGISRQGVSARMPVCRQRPAMQPLPPYGNQLPGCLIMPGITGRMRLAIFRETGNSIKRDIT